MGLLTDVRMVAQRCGERKAETLVRSITQGDGVVEALFGLEAKGLPRLTEGTELVCRLSPQRDENLPGSSTASSQTTHDLVECLREGAGLALELGSPMAPRLDEVVEEFSRFFCAFSSVGASVTRCLPGSLGKVSMTRGAGLTRPSSLAVAAWRAMRSSLRASARRRRHAQRVSGSTKWACEGLT